MNNVTTQDDEGLKVVLSPAQLVAVMNRYNITDEETIFNRLMGDVDVAFAILEYIGAGILCLAPEPTGATKFGCVVVAGIASDTMARGLRQKWSGRVEESALEYTIETLAKQGGLNQDNADLLVLGVTVGVPMAFGSPHGATRVARVQRGRIRLNRHEALLSNPHLGGHTLREHIGKTEAWLRQRLKDEPLLKVASTFTNQNIAEEAITRALQINDKNTRNWIYLINQTKLMKSSTTFKFDVPCGKVIGYGVIRASDKLVEMTTVRVVLKYETYNGIPFYVLTAFPKP